MPPTTAILGLGLIGGSLARDLRALGVHLLGHDADPATREAARADGIVQELLGDGLEGLESAGLVVLATPVDTLAPLLHRVAPRLGPGAVVTDAGSTKARVLAAAGEAGIAERFVGSHPMAGDHRSGWEAGRSGLFRDALVHLCASSRTSPTALATVEALWTSVGARCVRTEAGAHDTLMAWVSHLPQVTASAVAAAIAAAGAAPADLGRGGRDVTRLAGSSPAMWSAVARENAGPLREALRGLQSELDAFTAALEAGDGEALRRFFSRGRDWRGGDA